MTTARRCGILLLPGCSMLATAGVTDGLHALFVVSSESSINALARRARRAPVPLAGIEDGSAIPAEADVLILGERTTVRWRLTDALIDEFLDVVWTGNVWEINGSATRLSCGGTASVDLMLAWLPRRPSESAGLGSRSRCALTMAGRCRRPTLLGRRRTTL